MNNNSTGTKVRRRRQRMYLCATMSYRFYDCRVLRVIDETERVKRFFIKAPDDIQFRYKAGQFVLLDLPIPDKVTTRGYSIASPPSEDNVFEIAVAINPNGLGTPYMFSHFKEGAPVKVSEPLGKFSLPDIIDADICFICTGTGIAPIRSMLLDMFNRNIPHQYIYLIFGNRREEDILYRKEMEELAARYWKFVFMPVLSRGGEGWTGLKGYVHPVYEALFANRHPAYFYVCGWHEMVKEARMRIEALGYDRKRIRFELFD